MALLNFLIICASVATISAWTIDLPEVKKEVTNKHNHEGRLRNHQISLDKKENINNYENRDSEEDNRRIIDFEKFFEDASDEDEEEPYTEHKEDNKKQSYMEKKVHNIVRNGNNYLEGLKMALESYMEDVKSCSEENGKENSAKNDGTLEALVPEARRNFPICQYVTEHSDRIRQLSKLAIQTIFELQEKDYQQGYYGTLLSPEDEGMEERELILKLAWFLDQIAHLTGFDPNPERHMKRQTTTPRPPSLNLSVRPTPQPEIMKAMMECLNMNSSIPAAIRCSYPEQYLKEWREMYNNLTVSVQQSKQRERSEPVTFKRRENDQLSVQRQKRSIENNPLMNVLHYYSKHKAWTLENSEKNNKYNLFFVDSNDLPPKHLSKRSVSQDINEYLNQNAEAFINPSFEDSERINKALKDLHSGKRTLENIRNDLEILNGSRAKSARF